MGIFEICLPFSSHIHRRFAVMRFADISRHPSRTDSPRWQALVRTSSEKKSLGGSVTCPSLAHKAEDKAARWGFQDFFSHTIKNLRCHASANAVTFFAKLGSESGPPPRRGKKSIRRYQRIVGGRIDLLWEEDRRLARPRWPSPSVILILGEGGGGAQQFRFQQVRDLLHGARSRVSSGPVTR